MDTSLLDEKYGLGKWHCDDIIDYNLANYPDFVIQFLEFYRQPAADIIRFEGEKPKLFAKLNGVPVRVVMVSRFGDIGTTKDLNRNHGYDSRVLIPDLTDFSDKPF